VGTVARISAGVYEVWVDTTGLNGLLTGKWVSTGAGAAVATDSIPVGNAPAPGLVFGDLVENVFRRVIGPVQERTVTVNMIGGILTASPGDVTTVTFTGPQGNSILPGVKLSVDLEDMLVLTVPTTTTCTVSRGFGGSTPTAHANTALLYINSLVTRYDVGVAINDDLNDLSGQGLFRVGVAQLTWSPTFAGYDLSSIPPNFINILEVSSRTISPSRRFPVITNWELRRWNTLVTDSSFPSGQGIVIYDHVDPGMPVYVTYSAPFIPFVAVTDSITSTPVSNDPTPPASGYGTGVTAVPNLSATMTDIPPLGATAALIQPQEIRRNDMGAQPNPRKALDVPPQAISSSTNALLLRRAARISAEADRLYVAYPDRR